MTALRPRSNLTRNHSRSPTTVGGIPWEMHEYAFRMGRPPRKVSNIPRSVGVYGIGMKRAIFKIGRRCTVSTLNANKRYKIEITPGWMNKEEGDDAWKIPVIGPVDERGSAGTTIEIRDLKADIAAEFDKNKSRKSFSLNLMKAISTHYAYIIEKGFKVTINGDVVEPKTVRIACDKEWKQGNGRIVPFVFKGNENGVDVYLAVGLTGRIPSESRIDTELDATAPLPSEAGWTVVCNDRIVLYCDRTELTGWGDSKSPKYHTQYIGIAGIVEFKSRDPAKLPTTTTKTGIDTSSTLYRSVQRKMREGTRVFINYTNQWKSQTNESAKHIKRCKVFTLNELKSMDWPFEVAHALSQSEQFTSALPTPSAPDERQITFKRDRRKIETVSEHLFGKPDVKPSRVGAECFDIIYDGVPQ